MEEIFRYKVSKYSMRFWEISTIVMFVILIIVIIWWRISSSNSVYISEATTKYGQYQFDINKSSDSLRICDGLCEFTEATLESAVERCTNDKKCEAFSYDEVNTKMLYIDKDVGRKISSGIIILTKI